MQSDGLSAPQSKNLPLLDCLRASAAFLVLLGHTRNWFLLNIDAIEHPSLVMKAFWFVTVLQHEAVVVFFVLSGFLVGGAITSAIGKGTFDLKTYLIARFVRIYVVYVPALVLTALVFWIARGVLQDFGEGTIRPIFSEQQPDLGGLRAMLCHISGLQGFACAAWTQNPPLWSLGYEWSLYLIAPVILGVAATSGPPLLRALFVVLVLAATAAIATSFQDWAFWYFAWFTGVGAAWVFRTKHLPALAGIAGLALAAAAMMIARLKLVGAHEATDIAITLGIALAVSCRAIATFRFGARFFEWAASFSYSLYAIHLPLVFLLIAIFQNLGFPTHKTLPGPVSLSLMAISVLVPVLFAYGFSLVTERQTDRLRGLLKKRLSRPAAPIAEAQGQQP